MEFVTFMIILLGIALLYMSAWFLVAIRAKRFDVVDSAWGLTFIVTAWAAITLQNNFGVAQLLAASLVSIWGLRLTLHIAKRTLKKKEEDYRYQELREKWGKKALPTAYIRIFLLQGILSLLISLPVIGIAISHHAVTSVTCVGYIVWLFGIVYEAIADKQLAEFIKRRTASSKTVMDEGLWRTSRHPNYFGEVTTWWGAAIVALSLGAWWGIFGAALITFLIVWVSGIPPLEKHYQNNAAYQQYAARTSKFIPLPRKRT